jgi:hypothetical protein
VDHFSWSVTLKLAAACRSIYTIFKRKTRAPFFVAILVRVCECVYTCKWDVAVCILWQAGGCKVTGWINEPRRCVKVPWFCWSNWSWYPLQTKTSSKECDLTVCSCNLKTWHSFKVWWVCWIAGSVDLLGWWFKSGGGSMWWWAALCFPQVQILPFHNTSPKT